MLAARKERGRLSNATPERREARRSLKRRIRATPEGRAAEKAKMALYWKTPQGRAVKKAAKARRRALKKAAIMGRVSAPEIAAMFEAFRKACAYCGSEVDMTIDHFVPLARGGSHTLTNLVAACKSCNSSKSDRDPFEFLHDRKRHALGLHAPKSAS